jgi:hypothetical protein
MQRCRSRCPRCSQPLGRSWDMWGEYYVCPDCGFAAEDDDDLAGTRAGLTEGIPVFLARTDAQGPWQAAGRR